ncbi:MAG: exosortase C-terminal domain/associated protein EpsI, partial [Pyrinomonadaceae bacterium]
GTSLKLASNWWVDENYSHGFIIPVVIGLVLWLDRAKLRSARQEPNTFIGYPLILFAMLMLLAGVLGAELYIQRISIVVFLAGVTIYFFGRRLLLNLLLPLTLLLFAIPIPQILFNKLAFPLQLWASQIAGKGMQLFGIPSIRKGNIIELIPIGAAQSIALEVVEACSGVRSLMTLATLALLLAYFTKRNGEHVKQSLDELYKDPFTWRAMLLVLSSIPIALITNAFRVTATGVLTYYYGAGAAEGTVHEVSGFVVFISAFILLAATNMVLLKAFPNNRSGQFGHPNAAVQEGTYRVSQQRVLALFVTILTAGVLISWLENRVESKVQRRQLSSFPMILDGSLKIGDDKRFSEETERVLGASDYVMREYRSPYGQKLNLFIGYYDSQRTGATYHSPRNCLPGSGWEMKELDPVQLSKPDGTNFEANKYLVQRGEYKGLMIYWFQGRGRTNSSEYWDKADTFKDSVLRNRSDGAIIRVMTPFGDDESASLQEAISLSNSVAKRLSEYVPD